MGFPCNEKSKKPVNTVISELDFSMHFLPRSLNLLTEHALTCTSLNDKYRNDIGNQEKVIIAKNR